MKIAYLANIRYPSERAHSLQITEMCKAFSGQGCNVTLFVNTRSMDTVSKITSYYKTNISFVIQRISSGFFTPNFPPSFYVSELYFACSFFLTTAIKDFDFIYSRHEWVVWFLSIFTPRHKLVWESHEAKWNYPARQLARKRIRTVVISDGIKDFYRAKGVPDSQMCVAYDAIDESFFDVVESKITARERLGLKQDAKIVMYIGGFDAWKGIETFCKAAQSAKNTLFVAIGGLETETKTYKSLFPEVIFLGSRPYFELKHNQQAADILVIPNTARIALSAAYTSPLKLFAHLTSAIPLVVADVGSIISVTGRTLVTVAEPDNSADLSYKVLEVFDQYASKIVDAEELRELSMQYTWTNRAKSIITFLSYA